MIGTSSLRMEEGFASRDREDARTRQSGEFVGRVSAAGEPLGDFGRGSLLRSLYAADSRRTQFDHDPRSGSAILRADAVEAAFSKLRGLHTTTG